MFRKTAVQSDIKLKDKIIKCFQRREGKPKEVVIQFKSNVYLMHCSLNVHLFKAKESKEK